MILGSNELVIGLRWGLQIIIFHFSALQCWSLKEVEDLVSHFSFLLPYTSFFLLLPQTFTCYLIFPPSFFLHMSHLLSFLSFGLLLRHCPLSLTFPSSNVPLSPHFSSCHLILPHFASFLFLFPHTYCLVLPQYA